MKKQIANAVLAEASIDEDREILVTFRTDFATRGERKELTILSV